LAGALNGSGPFFLAALAAKIQERKTALMRVPTVAVDCFEDI